MFDNLQIVPKTQKLFFFTSTSLFLKNVLVFILFPFYDKEYFPNTVYIFQQKMSLNTSFTLLFLSFVFIVDFRHFKFYKVDTLYWIECPFS